MQHATGTLAARHNLTAEAARALAIREGASHEYEVDFGSALYYRVVDGQVQVASALQDGARWMLSTWTPRTVNVLPKRATAIARRP